MPHKMQHVNLQMNKTNIQIECVTFNVVLVETHCKTTGEAREATYLETLRATYNVPRVEITEFVLICLQ
jgi:hypothetical protein